MNLPFRKKNCMFREPRPARGFVTKPRTSTSPPRPETGSRDVAKSRPRAA